MDDLITAAATIHAAQIQANYALWAALISSIVGAAGIVFAAWFAWQSGIKLQQHNNIMSAKREVYLDSISKFQQALNDLRLVINIPEKFNEIFLNNKKDFLISVNKVNLICDNKNKQIVESLVNDFHIMSDDLYDEIGDLLRINDELNKTVESIKLANKEYEYYKAKENAGPRKLHMESHLLGKELFARVENLKAERRNIYSAYKVKLEATKNKISLHENELNKKYISFSNALRNELKIEN